MNAKIIYLCEDEYIIHYTEADIKRKRWAELMAIRNEMEGIK